MAPERRNTARKKGPISSENRDASSVTIGFDLGRINRPTERRACLLRKDEREQERRKLCHPRSASGGRGSPSGGSGGANHREESRRFLAGEVLRRACFPGAHDRIRCRSTQKPWEFGNRRRHESLLWRRQR